MPLPWVAAYRAASDVEPPLPSPPEHPGQPLGAPAGRRPFSASLLAVVAVYFQDELAAPSGWGYSAGTAQTVLTTIVAVPPGCSA